MDTSTKPASTTIAEQHRHLTQSLPFGDTQDFEDVHRGFIAPFDPGVVRADDGRVVWDNDSYSFLDDTAPTTVNPSLWRQSGLLAVQGLYEVTPGVYQLRGIDLSVMTVVEGDTGIIVVDPLLTAETARAGLRLYREHRGERPVRAVIYTHSHADHFGGVRGVVDQVDVDEGRVQILAPAGFVEHAIAENVFAGTAMARRAGYMYGAALPRGPQGQVGAGLGQTTSTGDFTLIPPTVAVHSTGEEHTLDGVRIIFQMAPGSEAPSEFHFFLPDLRVLCMAENATHTLHNILTIRGALVRDPHVWASYITEAIDLFGAQTDIVIASHHWPTWGHDRCLDYLGLQRDLYAYLHDQTLRMMNRGMTGTEIAEVIQLPPALENAWHARGYYGSVSHNVKGIYQRYMGWYDGNPVNLWKHPPAEAGTRYLEFMGGADAVVEKARASWEAGDFRWVAEVLGHVVFAEPDHEAARELLADTLEQLGYGSENGTWRCAYLSGAHELRHGAFGTPISSLAPDVLAQLTPTQLFDSMTIRVNGPRCWDDRLTLDVDLTDVGARHRLSLAHGVLTQSSAPQSRPADLTLTLTKTTLGALLAGDLAADQLVTAGVELDGDASVLGRLLSALDAPDPDFEIVIP